MSESPFAFENLVVYQDARAFRIRIYRLTRLLPKWEMKLKIQMCDAARSLTNNVAEGHGRYTYKDRKRFFTDARASLQELIDDVNICKDEGYAKLEHLDTLRTDSLKLLKRINGYMKYLRAKAKGSLTAPLSHSPFDHLTT